MAVGAGPRGECACLIIPDHPAPTSQGEARAVQEDAILVTLVDEVATLVVPKKLDLPGARGDGKVEESDNIGEGGHGIEFEVLVEGDQDSGGW